MNAFILPADAPQISARGGEAGQARVLIAAFSARYALGQLLDEMFRALSSRIGCWALVPTNYSGNIPPQRLYRAPCGVSKLAGVLASFSPRAHWKTVATLVHCKPDIVHLLSGEGYAWAISLAFATKLMGIPLIVTLHDPESHPGSIIERLNSVIRLPVLALARTIHVFSAQHLKQVRKQAKRTRIAVVAHGSLAGQFLRHRQCGTEREDLVLFFGRIQRYKGIDVLLEAMSSLPAKTRLAIAGPGELEAGAQRMIGSLGSRVELHNRFLGDAEVAVLMQRARVVALPYRHATQSSVPAIAAAFGCSVVATALGHFVEEVPELGGFLVPPEDPAALAAALAKALATRLQVPASRPTFDDLAASFVELYLSSVNSAVSHNGASLQGHSQ
jgi:glycosyltransferase involved in cell wall biosynthesis